MGPTELVIIVFILLIIFGGKLLPKIGKNLGDTIREIRTISKSDDEKSAGRTTDAESGSGKKRSSRESEDRE